MTKLPFSPPTPDPNKAPQPPRPQQPSEDNARKPGIVPSKPKAAIAPIRVQSLTRSQEPDSKPEAEKTRTLYVVLFTQRAWFSR